MRKETDMEEIRQLACSMLEMEICGQNGPLYPIFIDHPFFTSCIVADENGEAVDITTEEGLAKAKARYKRQIVKADKPQRIMHIVAKPYQIAFLKLAKPYLSLKDFSKMWGDTWVNSENPNQDPNITIKQAAKWFRECDKEYLMSESELEVYNALPETIEIYRGVAVGRNPNGLSWTQDKETAEWFAHRFDEWRKPRQRKAYVKHAVISKSDVLAYFEREQEIVAEVKDWDIVQ